MKNSDVRALLGVPIAVLMVALWTIEGQQAPQAVPNNTQFSDPTGVGEHI